jgi:hypothetical protein
MPHTKVFGFRFLFVARVQFFGRYSQLGCPSLHEFDGTSEIFFPVGIPSAQVGIYVALLEETNTFLFRTIRCGPHDHAKDWRTTRLDQTLPSWRIDQTLQLRFVEIGYFAAAVAPNVKSMGRFFSPWKISELDLEYMSFPSVGICLKIETVNTSFCDLHKISNFHLRQQ